jgi:hypothetical protein
MRIDLEAVCSICLEGYSVENPARKVYHISQRANELADHFFHGPCLIRWINERLALNHWPSCPVCRNFVDQIDGVSVDSLLSRAAPVPANSARIVYSKAQLLAIRDMVS